MQRIRALEIATKALQTRRQYLNIGTHLPICPYVLSEVMGFDLRFVSIPSFEGMYVSEENLILISSERPEGRKRFSCAHEIGHHVLRHGTIIDEILKHGSDMEQEKEADFFGAILLMPKIAVQFGIKGLGKTIQTISKQDIYILSKYFGVSYYAFLVHLRYNLRLISATRFNNFQVKSLSEIKKILCPLQTKSQVLVVGDWWQGKAIDVEVGDIIVFASKPTLDGPNIINLEESSEECVFSAKSPGIARVYNSSGWSCFIKVSNSKYQGMFQFKYEEDIE